MSDEPDIDKLLMRSAELEEVLSEFFDLTFRTEKDRILSSKVMCDIVFEHAHSIKILIASSGYTSAVSLYRLQYEVLVRAFWLLFAASDQWVSTLVNDVTPEGMEKANKLPSASEMVTALEGKVPENAVIMLRDFKSQMWKLLCSFVHGGFHALHRHGGGYPADMIAQVLKGSNGLCIMGGNLLIMIAGDPTQSGRISAIQQSFSDCLPEPKPNPR
jgi:hypothetical protein